MARYFVTVNIEVLVAVPPGPVTEIGPLFAPLGTVAVIVFGGNTVNFAFELLNFTAVAPVKFVPVMVTMVPALALLGEKSVIVGAMTTVNAKALVAVPPGVVTVIGPLVAPAGTVAVICEPLTLKAAFVPLNLTAVVPEKFVPLIVTVVPTPPMAGEMLVIVGAATVVTVKGVELVAVPPGVVTAIGPEVAPMGTIAVICVSESPVKVAFVPLKLTSLTPVKLVPVIATEVPIGPLVGEKPVIAGLGIGSTRTTS